MKRMLSLRITETLKQYEANDLEKGLYCEKCGNRYDLHTFSSGYEYRDGCEGSMIAAGKEAERKRKQKAVPLHANHEVTLLFHRVRIIQIL
ncbi:MAG: hypothetical protein L0I71_05730 [Lacticaseibacillus paracasei]|nr:hypothetical protein [Lacticaseibacillus paracasei]